MHLLKETLSDATIKSALVFSRTKHGADRIVRELLKSEISAVAIHGNKAQGARERALKDFKAGKCKVLVATDIAARGIDIDRVTHVINFNLPEDAESYVHRIGRTARAGRDGVSVSFCEATEVKLLKNVEKFIKYKIPVNTDHDFHVVHTKEEIAAQEKLKKEAKAKHLADRQKVRTKKRNSQNARSGSIRTKKAPSKNTKKKVTKKKRGSRR